VSFGANVCTRPAVPTAKPTFAGTEAAATGTMARLDEDKPGAHAVAKDLKKQVDRALAVLAHKRLTDNDVHEARKHLKKARASLRLLRPALKNGTYREWNAAMRDAARPLSAVRDAKVLLDTLRMLGERYPVQSMRLDGFQRVLNEQRARTSREVLGSEGKVLARSRKLLREARAGMDRLRIPRADDWDSAGKGLERVYARGRRAMSAARKTLAPDAFHEWRKQVKYLRYELEVLEPLWPGMIGELADQAHKLADYLGEEHDTSVLRDTALAHREAFRDARTLGALLALIDRCQSQLREKSLLLGARLYEEKPRLFANRFAEYWRGWRAEKSAA
jgi:CHAD domain-containing protein